MTHDQVEAMTMGHRVAVLEDGRLQQVGTPRNLYDCPVNAFVAGFIGSPAMNLRTAPLEADGARLGNIVLPLRARAREAARAAGLSEVTVGVRPESLHAADGGGAGLAKRADGLKIKVKLVEELGADAYVYGTLIGDDADGKPFVVRFDGRVPPSIGEILDLSVRIGEEHVFHPETGESLAQPGHV